jgi:hypothetical protein
MKIIQAILIGIAAALSVYFGVVSSGYYDHPNAPIHNKEEK